MSEQTEETKKMVEENKEQNHGGILPLGTKATIIWLEDDGKTVKSEDTCPRSMPCILQFLQNAAREELDRKAKIVLKIAEANEKGEPQTAEIELAEGPLEDLIEDVGKRVLPPEQAIMQFHLTVSKLMDLSNLKGAMITAVFEDAQAAGFAVLSESSPVEEADIKVLGASATAQASDFKHKMREGDLKIEFPDDPDTIIMPGDARHLDVQK